MTVSALRWFKAAIVLQILLLAYWLTIEVVALFPWNDVVIRPAGYDLRASLALNALPLLACTALFALGVRPLALVSALGYGFYLALQVWTWWKPFIIGASSAWQATYAESFARTLKILPAYGTRLPPDAQHITLQLLTLLTLLATAIAVSRMQHL